MRRNDETPLSELIRLTRTNRPDERAMDELAKRAKALEEALSELLDAVTEYGEYEHDGDPWTEDARAMGEMTLDDMRVLFSRVLCHVIAPRCVVLYRDPLHRVMSHICSV